MRHLLASFVLGAALLAAPTIAAADVFEFDALDSVFTDDSGSSTDDVVVTGRRTSDGASATVTLASSSRAERLERCYRLALMALNKPGRWRFTADGRQTAPNRLTVYRCGVTRLD